MVVLIHPIVLKVNRNVVPLYGCTVQGLGAITIRGCAKKGMQKCS